MTNNTLKKTSRKNKTNLNVNWPTTHFNVLALHKANPQFTALITLRTRIQSAVEDKTIVEIGCYHNSKGRPQKVYLLNPPSPEAMEAAKKDGVVMNSIEIMNMNSNNNAQTTPINASSSGIGISGANTTHKIHA